MAKIKVHNLAGEVGISNKELVAYLKEKGYEAITAVSIVPDSEIAGIRAKFGSSSESVSEQPKAEVTVEKAENAAVPSEEPDEGKPKKSGFVRVFRSQNATKQLQRRPRKPQAAQPKTPEVKPDLKEEPVVSPAPAKAAEETVPEIVSGKAPDTVTETVSDVTPAADLSENTKPEKELKPVSEEKAVSEITPEKTPEKAPEIPAEEKTSVEKTAARAAEKAENPAPEAEVKTAAPKKEEASVSTPAADKKVSSGSENASSKQAPAEEKDDKAANKPEKQDSGFRNGRIIRSIGRAVSETLSGRDNSRSSRNQDKRGSGRNQGTAGNQGRKGDSQGRPPRSNAPREGMRTDRNERSGFGQRANQGGRTPAGGRQGAPGGFAGRGPARGSSAPAPSADAPLARKTSRMRGDGKDRERSREERRELGRGKNETGRQGQNFSRIPKALQKKRTNAPAEKKEEAVTEIRVPERITVRDLADRMKIPGTQIIKELFLKGEMVTLNHEIPYEKAEEIALEHDIICEMEEKEDVIGALLAEEAEEEEVMTSRPPVVCVMGHVDHGKTSLLDAIRNTHVTDREAGGITQHIGAYMVSIRGQKITFLDTPGHEAFTAMRMRGANATDIAVLVVAADDGVMPQTVEAINHAKAAETEIIVAVNKIDKPGANIDRVKQELSEYGLVSEDWGGSTVFCPVSAKTQEGLDNLLEMILLTSEMHELKANANRKARGIVLEAKLDKGRGPVASILIQKGTLRQGDFIACGAAHGKVRAMTDENGRRLHKATPSMPVEIIGLNLVPEAGEVLVAMDTDREAKDFAAVFVSEGKKNLIEETKTQMSLDDLFNQIKEGNLKELPIVVKADVQGSVEAVSQSLLKLSNDEVVVKVIHGGVGAINESDVSLAAASNAIIIGFNVRPDATAKSMADTQKVDIHLYNVIYEAIEDVERALKGMRAAVYEEKIQGHAEIRQIFKASGVGNIAGAYIRDGIFTRNSKVRIFRGQEKIYEGALASLKRFKDDVKEVREGYECGFVFDGFGDFEVEDTVEAYIMVEVPRE